MSLVAPEKSIEYTPEQSLAITTRDVSVALAAGAGCGKTFVLTQRFLEELAPLPGRDPVKRLHELVAITFTDAAARELRTRVRRQCHAAWQRSSGAERDYWQKLIRSFDSCRISTIHSFCGNLLRAHPFEAGIDPLATVLEGAAAMVLEAEAIDDTLRGLLAARDDDAMLLATTWNIDGVRRRVAQMMKEYRHGEFRRWQSGTPEELLGVWQEFYEGQVWPAARASWSPLASLLRDDLIEFPYHVKVEPAKLRLLELLERVLAETLTADELPDLVGLCGVQRNFTKPKWEDEERYVHFKENATRLRDAIKKLGTIDLESEGARAAAELGIGLVRVTARAARTYEQVKQSRGALDFDDLLARTHQLLTAPETQSVQREVSGGIALLMVDEFQDTNRQQVDIVRAIVGHAAESGRLFFVGDEKQSIYRFRGAEPEVFHELRREVTQQGRLPLSMNFRTQPAVLRFVNHLFEQTFAPHYQPLVASRPQVTTPPGVEFLWTLVEGHAGIAGWAESCRRAEARGIARRLRELLDNQTPIVADPAAPNGARGARAGDVAILFRALSDVQYYEEALRDEGIEYYLVGGHAFYSQQEIYDVLHLLRVVVSRCDEVSLAGVLRSPFFSLTDETLYWLATTHGSLEAGLFAQDIPAEIESSEQRKVASARDTLTHLRRLKDQATVPELLGEALDRTGYDAALLAEFMGERKLANVYKLIEQARASASSGVASVDQFVTQLARFTVDQPREALATTTPEAADVVRLMTIHMAKGLEFPVVVVPDINRKLAPSRVQALFHPQLGPLAKGDDTEAPGTTGLDLFRKIDQIDSEAESQRLFYVACTRAKDYLILSGSTGNLEEKRQNWLEVLARAYDLGTGVPLGPSVAVAESNEPLVSVVFADTAPARGGRQGGRPRSLERLLTKVRAEASKPSPQHAATADPVPFDPAWRRRFSVTRLSGRIIPSDHEWWPDDEASEAEGGIVDPIGFGTLVHAVLERIDLGRLDDVGRWCQSLAPQHDILHTSQAAAEAEGLVERFLRSSRGTDLRNARQVEREVEFTMSWPLGAKTPESRFIQGYLDCLYEGEDGKWRIVDYKTNNVAASGVAKEAAKYELQMLAYALAVEQCWGRGPDELVLHFLRPGEEHVFGWDATTRAHAIERIDQAIAQAQQQVLA